MSFNFTPGQDQDQHQQQQPPPPPPPTPASAPAPLLQQPSLPPPPPPPTPASAPAAPPQNSSLPPAPPPTPASGPVSAPSSPPSLPPPPPPPPPPTPAQEPKSSSIHQLAKIIPRSKDLPWYQPTYGSRLTAPTRDLLENYAHIPPEEVEEHVYRIRDEAWNVFPFPCIGEFWFLTLGLSAHPHYPALLSRLTTTTSSPAQRPTLIDLGTCLGQDLRKLVHDGAISSQLLGVDIFPAFEAVGHALFHDAEKFADRFLAADLLTLSSPGNPLAPTRGTWDIVSSCMFLHSFDWAGQVVACRAMLDLVRRGRGGSGGGSGSGSGDEGGASGWIIGGLTANTHAREQVLRPPFVPEGVKRSVYLQSRESFVRLWDEARRGGGDGVDGGDGDGVGDAESEIKIKLWAEYDTGESESGKANEGGAGRLFGLGQGKNGDGKVEEGGVQKLLWFLVEVL